MKTEELQISPDSEEIASFKGNVQIFRSINFLCFLILPFNSLFVPGNEAPANYPNNEEKINNEGREEASDSSERKLVDVEDVNVKPTDDLLQPYKTSLTECELIESQQDDDTLSPEKCLSVCFQEVNGGKYNVSQLG